MAAAQDIRSALVSALTTRTAEISDEVAALIEGKVDHVREARIDREWINLSNHGYDEALRHLLAHPEDLEFAEVPVGALSLVRELARRDVPLYDIIRAYQMGHAHWFEVCTQLLATVTHDTKVFAAESVAVSAISQGYLDRMCQRVAATYEDERDRWLRQEESLRLDRVLTLLEGAATDDAEAERALGYRLRQEHIAVVAWVHPADTEGDELIRAQRAIAEAAMALRSRGRALVIARDSRTAWAWIPQPGVDVRSAGLEDLVRVDGAVRLAFGRPAPGIAGFSISHKQAAAAAEVGRASKAAAIFDYDAVAALVFLVSDLERSRDWVREVLGQLVRNTRREQSLRQTLHVYLQSGQSVTAAARSLNCHKNTVLYRIRIIEKMLGRQINTDTLSLGLALHAHRWLGADLFE